MKILRVVPQALGDECLLKTQVFIQIAQNVFRKPCRGRQQARTARPSTSSNNKNMTRVREVLQTDRRMSVRLMVDMLNIPRTIAHEAVPRDLHMRKCLQSLSQEFWPTTKNLVE